MKRVVVYCRKSAKPKNSKERQEENKILSLDSQENELTAFAKSKGFEVVKLFKENESAYVRGRPLFNEMMELFSRKEADYILVWNLTRIARNPVDGAQVIHYMDLKHLQGVITPNREYRDSADDKFFLGLELAMSKKSSDDTSSYVRRDIAEKANKGEYPGNAPLGYLNIGKDGRIAGNAFETKKQVLLEELGRPLKRIEIDPILGVVIRQLFEDAAKGIFTLEELSDRAFSNGLRARRSGNKLAKSSVKMVLENCFFYGVFEWEGRRYTENIKHEALVSKQLYDKVQTALRRTSFHKKPEKEPYLLSSLIVCSACGKALAGQTQKSWHYYFCMGRRDKGDSRCTHKKYHREEDLDRFVLNRLSSVNVTDVQIEFILDELKKEFDHDEGCEKARKFAVEDALATARKKLTVLKDRYLSPANETGELIGDDEYIHRKKAIESEVEQLQNSFLEIENESSHWMQDIERFLRFSQQVGAVYGQSQGICEKRGLISEVGKFSMNPENMALELNYPLLFTEKIEKMTPKQYEPDLAHAAGVNDDSSRTRSNWLPRLDSNQ